MSLSEPEAKQGRLQDDLHVVAVSSCGEVELIGYDGWDGSDATPQTFVDIAGFTRAVADTDEVNDVYIANDSTDDEVPFMDVIGAERGSGISRKQRKALDREVPWRQIMTKGDKVINEYIQAIHKEADSWDKHKTITAIVMANRAWVKYFFIRKMSRFGIAISGFYRQ